MLGKFVRVRITNPVGSLNRQYGYRYSLNFGSLEGRRQFDNRFAGAYIMGVHHPVRHFDGRAIAVLYREGERKGILVVAPKNMRFIGYQSPRAPTDWSVSTSAPAEPLYAAK